MADETVGYEYCICSRALDIATPDMLFRMCQEHKILESIDSFCFDTCLNGVMLVREQHLKCFAYRAADPSVVAIAARHNLSHVDRAHTSDSDDGLYHRTRGGLQPLRLL